MKKIWKPICLAAAVMMSLAACTTDDDASINNGDVVYMLPETRDINLTGEQLQMRDNNNDFACRLFNAINQRQEQHGSTIVSPISVSYVLGMLNAGADGETRDQIMDVLGLGNDPAAINAYCKKMIDEAPLVDPSVTLKIANSIYVNSNKGINLYPQYQSDMQQYYSAQIEALDFNQHSSLDIINNWCKTHTGGMIPTILDDISDQAVMYLLNAIYYKATWTEKFDPKDTRDMDFTLAGGTTAKHKMMHRKALAAYGQNSLCQMLCLPYGSGSYAMYVMLPNEGKTVDDVIQSLSAQGLERQLIEMYPHEVDILMPRFTTSTETVLEQVLSSMGMPLAFDPLNAQFPYMAQGHSLYVSKMRQKARIEVNEEGTKAAAVTIAEMRDVMDPGPRQYEKADFHATRPFVYYIMEMSTRSIFFMGTFQGEQ